MAALPYMPLFVADYLADAAHLTTQQHGAYLLLIFNYWQRGGPLPDDDKRLASIARVGPREWAKMRDTLSEFFEISCGKWSHKRVDVELARVEAKSLKSKKAAKASVQRRFGERSTDVEPTDTQAHTSEAKASSVVADEKREAIGACLQIAWPCPEGVDPAHWRDFKRNRKTRRLTNSETAYLGQLRELERLSDDEWPPGRLVQYAAEKGWGSINDPREQLHGRSDTLGRNQPADGLSSTARASLSVFGR